MRCHHLTLLSKSVSLYDNCSSDQESHADMVDDSTCVPDMTPPVIPPIPHHHSSPPSSAHGAQAHLSNRESMKHSRSSLPTPMSTNSFWHSEPNNFLIGHRTTADLPPEADVVIVGSGITGASAARFLAEDERARGKRLVLLEAREACWGATGRVSVAPPL